MKWRREIDYHGSRSYSADRSDAGPWGAVMAWLSNIAGRKASKRDLRQKSSTALPPGTHRGFSLIATRSPAPKHDSVDCPFPLKSGVSPHGHDWRILP